MESRNFSLSRIVLLVLIGALLVLIAQRGFEFAQGVILHDGSVRKYFESQRKTAELKRALDIINTYYVDGEKVELDAMSSKALDAILRDLDPYSEYLNRSELDDLRVTTDQEFGGIGIRVEMKDEGLTIVAPMDGTPGAKAGLLRGDRIQFVDGDNLSEVPFRKAIDRLRGPPGSKVTLGLYRPSNDKAFEVDIVRERIEVENVSSIKLLEPGIGYLRISLFGGRTGEEMIAGIDQLIGEGMKGLIIDLRGNPGGLLDAAVDVASPFLSKGDLVVYTEGRRTTANETWRVSGKARHFDFPLVLLVNGGSASASEIVSGALKDAGRATLVGEKTFGKGSVQSIIPIGDTTGIRLTTAKYYTPGGYVIHGNGIEPDVAVELEEEELEKLTKQRYWLEYMSEEEFAEEQGFEPIEDRQLSAAIEALREKLQ